MWYKVTSCVQRISSHLLMFVLYSFLGKRKHQFDSILGSSNTPYSCCIIFGWWNERETCIAAAGIGLVVYILFCHYDSLGDVDG